MADSCWRWKFLLILQLRCIKCSTVSAGEKVVRCFGCMVLGFDQREVFGESVNSCLSTPLNDVQMEKEKSPSFNLAGISFVGIALGSRLQEVGWSMSVRSMAAWLELLAFFKPSDQQLISTAGLFYREKRTCPWASIRPLEESVWSPSGSAHWTIVMVYLIGHLSFVPQTATLDHKWERTSLVRACLSGRGERSWGSSGWRIDIKHLINRWLEDLYMLM